jgi:sarcosine oxidase subunit gamma
MAEAGPVFDRPGVAMLAPAGPLGRFVLRCRPEIEGHAGDAFACVLPGRINRATSKGERGQPGGRAALRLGPDEFLLIVPAAEREAVLAAIGQALAAEAHALVDVSERQKGFLLTGARAARLLNAGCPLDLDPAAFPVGMATRTLFLKAEILLWRVAEDAFRIEIGRSLAPYLVAMLEEAVKDIA